MDPMDENAHAQDLRIEQVLGKNAFETTQLVYLETESGQRGPYVRKLINRGLGLGGAYVQLWKAQRGGFASDCLPRICALAQRDDSTEVLIEYVEGQTLAEAITACSDFEQRLALTRRAFPQLCRAVAQLHTAFEAPIIHRDLKPSNIMLCGEGVKLLDLGIARLYKQGAERDTKHLGTRPYAPPEQYGFGQTDVRSDVYALGKVLYFCLTGEDPATDVSQGLETHGEIPGELRRAILHATKLDPAARPANVAALQREFEKATGKLNGSALAKNRPLKVLGAIWDVVLLLSAAIIATGAVSAFVHPTPENQQIPTWYLFYSLFIWALPCLLITLYLVCDRRPLHRFIPATRAPIRRQTVWGLVAIAVLCLAWLAVTLAFAV